MEKYVTFEQAKWLKEKGMYLDGYLQDVWLGNKYEKKRGKIVEAPVFGLGSSSKLPEQHQVVDWLLEKHGIWVSVGNVYSEYTHWAYGIGKENKGMILPFRQGQDSHDYFNSPQQAYSAAFDYIRNNNLI